MRRDLASSQRWCASLCGVNRFGKTLSNARSRHAAVCDVWQQGGVSFASDALDPLPEQPSGAFPKWNGSLLAPLAVKSQTGSWAKIDVRHAKRGDLGHPGPGVVQQGQQHAITRSAKSAGIGRFKNGLDFGLGKKAQGGTVKTLAWNCEHTLHDGETGRLTCGRILQEAANCHEAGITAPGAIGPVVLQVPEEGDDACRIQICHLNFGRRLALSLFDEIQE